MEFLIKEATLKQHESSSGRKNPCGACANMMLPWVIEVSYSSVVRCFGQRLKPQAANLQKKRGTVKPSATMPSPSPISVICFREEYMIQFFHRSHTKTPESGHFSDWIGNNTDDFRCSDWPKCRHPLVVDFSLHFCLRNEQAYTCEFVMKFLPAQFS